MAGVLRTAMAGLLVLLIATVLPFAAEARLVAGVCGQFTEMMSIRASI